MLTVLVAQRRAVELGEEAVAKARNKRDFKLFNLKAAGLWSLLTTITLRLLSPAYHTASNKSLGENAATVEAHRRCPQSTGQIKTPSTLYQSSQ